GPGPPAGAGPLRECRRAGRRFDGAWQRVLRRRTDLRWNIQLIDRIRLVLRLLGLNLRRLLDGNGDLVFAWQLRLPRRLLHLVAATAATAAGTGLTEPDDVLIRSVGMHGC